MEGWKNWIGKRVYIILKNQRKYIGTVLEVDIKSPESAWMTIEDRDSNRVTFSISDIELIQEEGGKRLNKEWGK